MYKYTLIHNQACVQAYKGTLRHTHRHTNAADAKTLIQPTFQNGEECIGSLFFQKDWTAY